MFVFFFYRCDGIWFSMCFTVFLMIAFTNNPVVIYQQCPYHWIRSHISCPKLCQLNTAVHVFFMSCQFCKYTTRPHHSRLPLLMTVEEARKEINHSIAPIYEKGEA